MQFLFYVNFIDNAKQINNSTVFLVISYGYSQNIFFHQSEKNMNSIFLLLWSAIVKYIVIADMEYCATAASMVAEVIFQIVEGFVEVPHKSVGSIEETWKKCS